MNKKLEGLINIELSIPHCGDCYEAHVLLRECLKLPDQPVITKIEWPVYPTFICAFSFGLMFGYSI